MNNTQKMFFKIATGLLVASLGIGSAFAAALTNMSDTLSSVKISNPSNHTFIFYTPSGVGAGSTTVITFPAGFSIPVGFSFADVDVATGTTLGTITGSTTLASTASGNILGIATTTTTLTISAASSVAIPAGSYVSVKIGTNATFQSVGTFQITNAASANTYAIAVGGTMFDNGTTTVNLITNDTVAVNAIVPQALTFSISSSTINFGNLGSGAPRYASSSNPAGDSADNIAHNLQISTNAPSGYTITVQGQTLTSQQNPANTITANGATPLTSIPGNKQFGIYAAVVGGTGGTLATPYATASSFGYNATATTSATFATGNVATANTTYNLHYIANISALTEAGTYSANLVYVGTSNF
jgi:hypothetical protein